MEQKRGRPPDADPPPGQFSPGDLPGECGARSRSCAVGAARFAKLRWQTGLVSSRWWNPGERRSWPVLPVGARRPADKAREGGAPTGRTGPGVFRPKRNDERRAATRFSRDGSPAEPPPGELGRAGFHHRLSGRDGSPAEPPPGELGRAGFTTGCLAGMDRRPSPHRENWAAWVSPPAGLGPSGSARASGKTVDSKFPHQSGNPLAPHPPSLHPQFPVDSRRAVLAVMAGVDAADLLLEKLVHPRAATLGTTLPSVVTAPRDSERAGHGGDSVLSPVPVHEPVDHLVIHGAGETPSVHASRRLLAQAHRRRFRKTAATGVDFRP